MEINYDGYDHIIVYFSGGKDSTACLLRLLETGCPKEKIELWHHEVDGREGSTLMDWPVTPGYCQAIADHFDIPIFFSWREGGFEREMLREDCPTAPTHFEMPDGKTMIRGGKGKSNTRLRFPQVSANLSVRWCSAYLKIDVACISLKNQVRFIGKRILTVSGERAEESPARAKYKAFEPDRADTRNSKRVPRHIDRWRPVHSWPEIDVWDIIQRYQINPHPAYHLGWGRVSCRACIFGSHNQWASIAEVDMDTIAVIAKYERQFDCTIHRTMAVQDRCIKGTPYQMDASDIKIAMSKEYRQPVWVENWKLPAGAFGESCGPS